MYDRRAAVEVDEGGVSSAQKPRDEERTESDPSLDNLKENSCRVPSLRSAQARSIDGGGESPSGSPRARRPPRESRRVSLARTPDYIQLNQYKLLQPIGQGSYGIVKLAYNEEDDTHYAMKILSKKKLMRRAGVFGRLPPRRGASCPSPRPEEAETERDPLRRMYREIAVLKKLDHPNVVKLVEVLDDPQEDLLYLAFELVEGGPVREAGEEAPLPLPLARRYFRDALLAVEYLHYQRIVHRDIKPANLLVAADGRVLLGDLGGAGELGHGAQGGVAQGQGAQGTPAFRAPEVSEGTADPRAADVWSLGATLFSLVHGCVPFWGASVSEVASRIRGSPLTLPPDSPAPPALRHLLHRMLHKDPQQRADVREVKSHPWVTNNGEEVLPSTDDNCRLVEVTDEDMERVVTSIPNLATLILIKTMLKKHSFQNPFSRTRENSREGNAGESAPGERATASSACSLRLPHPALGHSGRSASAPSNYMTVHRQASFDVVLPSVTEGSIAEASRSKGSAETASAEDAASRGQDLTKSPSPADIQCKLLSLKSDR